MIAIVGKGLLYSLTAMALLNLLVTLRQGPHPQHYVRARPVANTAHCNYLLFGQTADSTYYEVDCVKPAHPWDTVYIVRDK